MRRLTIMAALLTFVTMLASIAGCGALGRSTASPPDTVPATSNAPNSVLASRRLTRHATCRRPVRIRLTTLTIDGTGRPRSGFRVM